jgi:protein tyrosine/serine phosphatase
VSYPITNLTDKILRWHQPLAADVPMLKQLGITKILKLDSQDDEEKTMVAPITVIYRPISFLQMHTPFSWFAMPVWKLESLVELVWSDPAKWLIHCLEGVDRTGLLCAAIRYKKQNWPKDKAYNEALSFGYHRILNQGLNKTWSNLK